MKSAVGDRSHLQHLGSPELVSSIHARSGSDSPTDIEAVSVHYVDFGESCGDPISCSEANYNGDHGNCEEMEDGSCQREEPILRLLDGLQAKGLERSVYFTQRRALHHALLEGDLETAESIIKDDKRLASVAITENGETVYHVAAAGNHVDFVKKLIEATDSSSSDLQIKNEVGCTALCYAAVKGSLEMAKAMVRKCPNLPLLKDDRGRKPVHYAVSILGKHKMVDYLWGLSNIGDDNDEEVVALLDGCIEMDIYDKAFQILEENHSLALAGSDGGCILNKLAYKRSMNEDTSTIELLASRAGLVACKCSVRLKLRRLFESLWEQALSEDNAVLELADKMLRCGFYAAQSGNAVFMSELLRCYPDVMFRLDCGGRTIFHIAVMYRQENIMRLLYERGSVKELVLAYKSDQNRNILHLVAEIAPQEKLNEISGAAFQMQRELLWFKEIEKMVEPNYRSQKDSNGHTPWELFKRAHSDMRKEAEEWMKRTAYCSLMLMFVTTIMAMVILEVSFRYPNVYDHYSAGIHTLQSRSTSLYSIFLGFSTTSLTSSMASMILFLFILTSNYTEEDFNVSLPLTLLIALSTLLVAVVTMFLAFSTTLLLFDKTTAVTFKTTLALLASSPAVFSLLYARLLFTSFRWTVHRPFFKLLKHLPCCKLVALCNMRPSYSLSKNMTHAQQLKIRLTSGP